MNVTRLTVEDRKILLALLARERRDVAEVAGSAARAARTEVEDGAHALIGRLDRLVSTLSDPGGAVELPASPVGRDEIVGVPL